jgi:hypothetical protein
VRTPPHNILFAETAIMTEDGDNSEKQRRKVALHIPVSVSAFAEAAGLNADEVIEQLAKMGIHARGASIIPKEVVQVIASRRGIEVKFSPPPQI